MAPPIVNATIQSAVLAATSNLLAQALSAYKNEVSLVIDWVPVFQFIVYAIISTPPNFMWQDLLESSFPAYHMSPTKAAVASAAANDEKALEEEEREDQLVEPKLNVANTLAKTVLDQTLGAFGNTYLFSLYIHSVQAAMDRPLGTPLSTPDTSAAYLASLFLGLAGAQRARYGTVDWDAVVKTSQAEFWSIIKAGWRLWPAVSIINFAFVKSIEGRNLVGGLAGVAWGIYMSLRAAS
ncbi:Mpv17/PMP22 family protein [Apiospora marii]|uniref:Mpv17/PMP22 family protein n=1 Tax=Apiospora marii TaxID=335849 RepID=UPI00312CF0C7